MKAVFRADPRRGGLITSSLAPANRAHEPRFCFFDGVVVIALVIGIAILMRLVLAH